MFLVRSWNWNLPHCVPVFCSICTRAHLCATGHNVCKNENGCYILFRTVHIPSCSLVRLKIKEWTS